MKKTGLFFTIFLITLSLSATSVFSFYGMPESFTGHDAIGMGMGDTGVGNTFRQNLSISNPSLMTKNMYTVFSTAFSFGNSTSKGDAGSFDGDQNMFPYFSMLLPYKQHRFAVNYSSVCNGIFASELAYTDPEGLAVTEVQSVDQSIFRTDQAYANKNRILDFGAGIAYFFGHDITFSSKKFGTDSLTTAKYEIENDYKAPAIFFGVSKTIQDKYSFGFSYLMPVTLKGDRTSKTIALTLSDGDAEFEMPAKYSLGAAYKINSFCDLAIDFDFEDWTTVNSLKNPEKAWRTAFGIEYAGNKETTNFFKKMAYRTGFSYRILPFKVNNNSVGEISGTFGLSLPIKNHDSRLDLALKIFKRGNTSDNSFEDSGFLITVGTLGFDIFSKPKDRRGHRDIPKPDKIGM